jgi:hypothetical protein
MKVLAGILSLTLLFAAASVFSPSAALAKKAKPTTQQSSGTKPASNEKKCDQTAGNNHNAPCY